MRRRLFLILSIALVLLAVVPLAAAQDATAEAPAGNLIPITLQLKWYTQSQFGGYYAALNLGYWKDEGLDVTIDPGSAEINPEDPVAAGTAQFGIDWMANVLAAREGGKASVNIAQVFVRNALREITWKDSNLTSYADLKGKIVSVWGGGNQLPLYAALAKNGIDPTNPDDVTIASQAGDMVPFISRQVDAAAAMTYNELALVLETVGQDGKFPLYTLDDLNVLDPKDADSVILGDLIFANQDWLKGTTDGTSNEEIAIKFLRGSFRGWAYCRDNPDDCVQYALAAGAGWPEGHLKWMMNEINKLIWPNEKGLGILDPAEYDQTVQIALDTKIITTQPDAGAFRTDLAQAALDSLLADMPTFDATGKDWKPADVQITAGGA